ncbi:glutamate--tRNA ligase [Candidatus Omnitrophota bacterium]
MANPQARVRFAPSPTGHLHLGGTRTALFNWLFARHHQGVFILRIEDTDQTRSSDEYLQQILDDLNWLGLKWDEGPFFQSQRSANYTELAQQLLEKGLAYNEGPAVILKIPEQSFDFTDLIRGQIEFAAGSLKDQVLIKSDGTPTYNFACVVDDSQMKITHVIRGEDHISNTPKQLAIYQALGFAPPAFAHIPLIVTQDRARLSKRKGAEPVSFYKDQGYLAEAIFNFLALLGWSPGDDRELLSPEEIVRVFSLERVVKSAAYFNPEKLEWMNAQYIQNLELPKLVAGVTPFLRQKQLIEQDYDQAWLGQVVELFRPRMKRLGEFPELADFFFCEKIDFTAEAKQFLLKKENTKPILENLIQALTGLKDFSLPAVEEAARKLIADQGIKAGELIHPTRVALTGKRTGPGLFELMHVLGKEKVLTRLDAALKLIT